MELNCLRFMLFGYGAHIVRIMPDVRSCAFVRPALGAAAAAYQLAGKRGLGYINWHRGRKYIHRRETLDAVTRDLKTIATDHIAVTGDLANLSLPIEYAAARAWLETLGPPRDVTVIPGNHDAYVPSRFGRPGKSLG